LKGAIFFAGAAVQTTHRESITEGFIAIDQSQGKLIPTLEKHWVSR
jgi:hypothetical protein